MASSRRGEGDLATSASRVSALAADRWRASCHRLGPTGQSLRRTTRPSRTGSRPRSPPRTPPLRPPGETALQSSLRRLSQTVFAPTTRSTALVRPLGEQPLPTPMKAPNGLPCRGSEFHADRLFAESDALHALCVEEHTTGRIRCSLGTVSGEQDPQRGIRCPKRAWNLSQTARP